MILHTKSKCFNECQLLAHEKLLRSIYALYIEQSQKREPLFEDIVFADVEPEDANLILDSFDNDPQVDKLHPR